MALELGGNSPAVILDDADLHLAVDTAVFGKFLHQDQICMSTNRIIVNATVHGEFVDRFAAQFRGLKVGDPSEGDTIIGPVINEGQLKRILGHIEQARAEGARQGVGGEPHRLVLPPHVFLDATNGMPIAREEQFGPVVSIITVSGKEEALVVANATTFGLSAAVVTRDVERGHWFALRIPAAMTHVNDSSVNDLPNCPFGGEKHSGVGRDNGRWAVEEFTTAHWISVQHVPSHCPL